MTIYDKKKTKENMSLWNSVNRTDPAHTKAVGFGRGFTAIDAHYQIMRATETFGSVGTGWGYDVVYKIEPKMIIAEVTIWQGTRGNTFGPICSIAPLYNKKDQLDDDAGKKAMTDALTKGLSHLGFSADVFLGKFDDNKYVQQVTKDIQKEEVAEIELPKDFQKIIDDVKKIDNEAGVTQYLKGKSFDTYKESEKVKARGLIQEHIKAIYVKEGIQKLIKKNK
jgi:hypothetical protein